MRTKMRRQKDPYAEESSEEEDEDHNFPVKGDSDLATKKEPRVCGHVNHSVNINMVRRKLKEGQPIGECTQCRKGHTQNLDDSLRNDIVDNYEPVIWLCVYCGHQGCDRNTREKHSFLHFKTPHSDPHCLILNTQAWNVWCYECDSEVLQTSSKKLHQVVEFIKRQKDMAPRRAAGPNVVVNKKTKDAPVSGATVETPTIAVNKSTQTASPDNSKDAKNQKNLKAGTMDSLPKVKGLSNLGNTCFFNSVMQSLGQTHFLLQLLDIQCQSGQRVYLPGRPKAPTIGDDGEVSFPEEHKNENGRVSVSQRRKQLEKKKDEPPETEETMELKPLDLMLSEGGSLTMAMSVFLKDMHRVGRNGILNPGHLFGQICRKSSQFGGYEQQDSHELLRCMLDAIRNEEILRTKRAILRAFALSEKTDPNSVAPRLKNMIKGYGKQATHTIVDQIFGGHLISTVFCEECHWSSQVFEPFMDLSLPINEEKGKPRKSSPSDEEISMLDCFPLGKNNANQTLSRHQQKKQKKNERKGKAKKGSRKGGGGANLTPGCIRANGEDFEDEKFKRRMTEKLTPEELAERERLQQEERLKRGKKTSIKRGESFKFKQKSKIRNQQKLVEEAEEDNSSEDLEYDQLSDDDDDSFGEGKYLTYNKRKTSKNPSRNNSRVPSPSPFHNDHNEHKGFELNRDQNEDEDESSSSEDSSEESSEEEETDGSDSPVASSKKKDDSTEMSDADVEDNTDSDHRGLKGKSVRHPSIVIISESENVTSREGSCADNRHRKKRHHKDIQKHHKDTHKHHKDIHAKKKHKNLLSPETYLKTSHSRNSLDYSTDTSERYFTAAERDCNGLDTGDDLDCGTDTHTQYNNKGNHLDQTHVDEMAMKVRELKIKRKSNSKENLLEIQERHKRGSTETLHTFNEKMDEGDESKRKIRQMKKLKQEWIARSLTTLAPRYQCRSQECSVMSCLTNFTAPELLTGSNKIICENCTKISKQNIIDGKCEKVKSNASKQMLILSPPAVLTLHLKRFHHVGFNLMKVNRYVQFPLVLDIAPFTSSISQALGNMSKGQSNVLYGLYGVVEHTGRLNSGHYVAYVRSRPLDHSRTTKQFLNLKPSNQFEVNQLVAEMAEKIEAAGGSLHNDLKGDAQNTVKVNKEELEEEIKSGRWFHVSDSYVAEVNMDKVMRAQAYLLFYERIV